MNLFVAAYEAREGRRLGSAYLIADAAHTRSDIYVTLGVMASFAGAAAGLPWVGHAWSRSASPASSRSWRCGSWSGSFNVLTDRAVIARESAGARRAGRARRARRAARSARAAARDAVYVDLIVHVDGDLTLRAAHDVADRIEEALQAAHPRSWTWSCTWSRPATAS